MFLWNESIPGIRHMWRKCPFCYRTRTQSWGGSWTILFALVHALMLPFLYSYKDSTHSKCAAQPDCVQLPQTCGAYPQTLPSANLDKQHRTSKTHTKSSLLPSMAFQSPVQAASKESTKNPGQKQAKTTKMSCCCWGEAGQLGGEAVEAPTP